MEKFELKDTKEILDLCIEVQKKLKNNFHPHTSIIIDFNGVRVEETVFGLPNKDVDKHKRF